MEWGRATCVCGREKAGIWLLIIHFAFVYFAPISSCRRIFRLLSTMIDHHHPNIFHHRPVIFHPTMYDANDDDAPVSSSPLSINSLRYSALRLIPKTIFVIICQSLSRFGSAACFLFLSWGFLLFLMLYSFPLASPFSFLTVLVCENFVFLCTIPLPLFFCRLSFCVCFVFSCLVIYSWGNIRVFWSFLRGDVQWLCALSVMAWDKRKARGRWRKRG